jgi:hypothetical protein
MAGKRRSRWILRFALAAVWLPVATSAGVAQFTDETPLYGRTEAAPGLFQAVDQGLVEAKLIPEDSSAGTVRIENKTGKSLRVTLPEAFVAVPLLSDEDRYAPRPQTLGGSFSEESQGKHPAVAPDSVNTTPGTLPRDDRRVLDVPAEEPGRVSAATVCLNPGLPEPSASIDYALRPMESLTQNAALYELCRMLGKQGIQQKAVQAAAWNIHNRLSWDAMSSMRATTRGATRTYFTSGQIRAGRKLAATAYRQARLRSQPSNQRGFRRGG